MVKKYFHQTSAKKIIGIIIIPVPGSKLREGKKYQYINNTQRGVFTFCKFAKRKFPGAAHIDFYDPQKPSGTNLLEQIILQ